MSNKLIEWNKILEFFGLEKEDEKPPEKNSISKNSDKVVSINRKKEYKVLFYNPNKFEESKNIVKSLKNSNVVIVNLENNKKELSQKILNFVSGAVYGLNANTHKIGKNVFLFAPKNIEINGKELEDNMKNKFLSK
ncbi:MAG TPA: cell division protein SepF [Halanaerobiales bacterium]|nr:cell division protein SepF [Halanaerobiales bacterium]